ncbi:mucin-binding protein, partial [Lactobacillus amylovorus]
SFKRDGYNDEVTGTDHWNAWKPAQQEFASVKSPEIQGYTADQTEIPAIKVNADSDNIERTVTYKANKQKLDVAFIDDTTGETLKTVTKDGVSDGSANYNTKNDIDGYKAQH